MSITRQGVCKCCGQVVMVETFSSEVTEEELNDMATEKCDCDGAVYLQTLARKKKIGEAKVTALFDKEPEVRDLLIKAIPLLYNTALKSITVKCGSGVKGSMKLNSEDDVTANRTYTHTDGF